MTILVTALLVAPAAALATHGYNDVDDSDFYHAAVDWMKANGVTVGCNPSEGNTEYCPDDFVTRGEMAVFLERLDSKNVFVRPGDDAVDGGNADTVDGMHAADFLGATNTAVDSAKLDGKDASAFFQVGDSINADTLDGKDATDFLGATEQASDSDLLDGQNSSAFASAAELAGLQPFIPVATLTVTGGSINAAHFRDPITSMPTITGSDGHFVIDFPGWDHFNAQTDAVVCSGLFQPYTLSLVSDTNEDLHVKLYESDGSLADDLQNEDDFTCAVYDN